MKLIYLYERRLPYENDHLNFGYDDVRDYGWEVEAWCLLGMTIGADINAMPKGILLDTGVYVKYINSVQEFEDRLSSIDKEDVFFLCYPYHAYDKTSYTIRKKLYNHDMKFANVTQSLGFDYNLTREVPFGFARAIKHFFRRYVLGTGYYFVMWLKSMFSDEINKKNFIDCWYRLVGPIIYPSYCNFITTELAYYFVPQPFCKWIENNVLVHTTSYVEYLRTKDDMGKFLKKDYMVFIDQGLINRDDVFLAMGDEVPIKNPTKYVNDLNNFFSKLEVDYGCEVIIAAHPKATYSSDTFGNRKIVFGKTAALIKDAKLVINQFSAAFFLAVMFEKDFIDIYTKEMWLTPRKDIQMCYKGFELIDCKLLDISDTSAVDNYREYIYHYDYDKIKTLVNLAIIDDNSCCRDKHFYEYVCEKVCEGKLNNYAKGK